MNETERDTSTERKRGGCLTIFLAVMILINPLTAVYYLVAGDTVTRALPSLPRWALPTLGVGALANCIFALGVWQWRKWGVYGFGVTSLVAFLINASYIGVGTAILGLLGIVILVLLVRPVWSQLQ